MTGLTEDPTGDPTGATAEDAGGSQVEIAAMRRALELSYLALGSTSPNPAVGAVILNAAGLTVGEGHTSPPGGPHAEVNALTRAGSRAHGGTLVVTLEPCAHVGRTGPCTQALLAAGIRRVVYAVADPTLDAGGGAAILRDAGVDVVPGLLLAPACQTMEAWLHSTRLGRPFVTWKYASSLDGRVAAADGSSRWVTGATARADGHSTLRAKADAVLVGVGTVIADDPHLTTRDVQGSLAKHQPLRVVADRSGRTPRAARVHDSAAQTLVSELAPDLLLAELYRRGVRSVLLEGGPTLAASFLEHNLIDKVVGYIAPKLLGQRGLSMLAGDGPSSLAAAPRLRIEDLRLVGDDVRITGYPVRRA